MLISSSDKIKWIQRQILISKSFVLVISYAVDELVEIWIVIYFLQLFICLRHRVS